MRRPNVNLRRRTFLKACGSASAIAIAAATGLLSPVRALAAEWNKAAFEAKNPTDVLKGIGITAIAESKDIVIKAPDIAENGATVPIEVTSNIAGTQSITILVEKNLQPLAASFDIANGAAGYVSVRLKVGQTTNIKAVVKAGGKSYIASKEVKVTIGGCGG